MTCVTEPGWAPSLGCTATRMPQPADRRPTWMPAPGESACTRLGGPEAVKALAAAFFDDMEVHEPALARTHAFDGEATVAPGLRERFALFLVGWLGGPQDYVELYGPPKLRTRHAKLQVDAALRDAWLRSMGRALDARGVQGAVRAYLDERFAEMAERIKNVPG